MQIQIWKLATALSSLALATYASPALSVPLPGPHWVYEYDISSSYIRVIAPLVGIHTATLGPGTMTIGRSIVSHAPPPDYLFAAALESFSIQSDYVLGGVHSQVRLEMHGDAEGTWGYAFAGVVWDSDPAIGYADSFQTLGTVTCTGGALVCGFSGLPDGTPVKIDKTVDQELSALAFVSLMATMTLPVAGEDLQTDYMIQGVRTAKRCSTEGVTFDGMSYWYGCYLPEPAPGVFVGLGLLGIALLRRR